MSPQGLQERVNSPQAATFMKQVLELAVHYVVTGEREDLLSRLTRVYIHDSTIIELPFPLRELWTGCGNQNSKKADLKVQTVLNYQQATYPYN